MKASSDPVVAPSAEPITKTDPVKNTDSVKQSDPLIKPDPVKADPVKRDPLSKPEPKHEPKPVFELPTLPTLSGR